MPVTFIPTQILAEPFSSSYFRDPTSALDNPSYILSQACPMMHRTVAEILQSSFDAKDANVIPASNGFVGTILEAYNRHRALIIRPDDVWLAILVQFNFFVNANAEALRSLFVNHEGKRQLEIQADGNRYSVDFGRMASAMSEEINKNVVDPVLRDWILPDFTTTTILDTTVCSIVMMATMKAYFDYKITVCCGIPRVTLDGEKSDWEKILERLERLKYYGPQTIAWYHLLHPVISRFVKAFDDPHSIENLDFWGRVAHYWSRGSGPKFWSGWITAFCAFSEEGKWLGHPFKEGDISIGSLMEKDTEIGPLSSAEFAERFLNHSIQYPHRPSFSFGSVPQEERLELDGTIFHRIDTNDVPRGSAEVDVLLDDNGVEFNTTMVAGQVGMRVSSSGDTSLSLTGERDSVRPVPGWWMFIKKSEEEIQRDLRMNW